MAAAPENRILALGLNSAEDLKDVSGRFSSKMKCYAIVSLSGDPRSRQRTPTDHEGNRDPIWNFPLKFHVPAVPGPASGGLGLEVLIRCKKVFRDKDVGHVHIPLGHVDWDAKAAATGGAGEGEGSVRFLSYRLRTPSGNPKGVLYFSYMFGDVAVAAAAVAPPPPPVAAPVGYPPLQAAVPYAAPAYPPQPGTAYHAYPPPAPAYGVPGYEYPPPPPPAGYGYPPPPPYGYAGQPVAPQQPPKNGKFGLDLGAGLLGVALRDLIGDAISDASAYDAGSDAGFEDDGGFDF